MRRRCVLCLTFTVLLSATTSARGETSAREEARRHYAEGQELFNSGLYEGALREFEAAYEAAPHPVVLKSQGECYERMGRVRDAIRFFERYLEDAPDAADADDIRRRIEAQRAQPGRLRINTNPSGATVSIDGATVSGLTPMDVPVHEGHHTIAIQSEGFQDHVEEFDMPFAGQLVIDANLVPAPTRRATTAPSTTPEPREGWEVTTPVWAMIGVTSAALITGIVTGSLALSDQGSFDDGLDEGQARSELAELGDAGTAKALVADISFGIAGAAAVTGIVLFFVQNRAGQSQSASRRRHGAPLALTPSLSNGGAGLQAAGSF